MVIVDDYLSQPEQIKIKLLSMKARKRLISTSCSLNRRLSLRSGNTASRLAQSQDNEPKLNTQLSEQEVGRLIR